MPSKKDVFKRHTYLFRSVGVAYDGDLGRIANILLDLLRWSNLFLLFYIHSMCVSLGVVLLHSQYDTVPTLVMTCGSFSGPTNLFKLIMLYRRRNQIKELMDQLNGYEVKGGVGTFAKWLMYCYEGMSYFFTTASVLKNAVEIPDLTVPYPIWEPFELNSQFRRTVHFFAVYYTIGMAWLVQASVDTSMLHMSNQLCHKLVILNRTLQLIGADEEVKGKAIRDEEVLPLDDTEDSTILKASLDEHIHLLKVTNSLSKILNEVFIYQLFSSMPVLLVCLYIFSNSNEWVNDTVAFSGALVVVFIQVLTTSWSGELIKTRFEQIHFAVYNSQWYDVDGKIKRTLLIMATFSSRPVNLRGAYVFNLSLQTYETFIRQAFSFLAVMYQFLN